MLPVRSQPMFGVHEIPPVKSKLRTAPVTAVIVRPRLVTAFAPIRSRQL